MENSPSKKKIDSDENHDNKGSVSNDKSSIDIAKIVTPRDKSRPST